MNNWLEQARAGSAALGEVRPSTSLKGRIERGVRRRKTLRGVGVSAGVVIVIAVVMGRAMTSKSTATKSTTSPATATATTPTRTTQELRFVDGSKVVSMTPETRVAIEQDDAREARAVLSTGGARFEVAPRAGKPFVVRAGDVTVRVVGTRFSVTRSAALVEVAVEHGEVEVLVGSALTHLRAGEAGSFAAERARVEAEAEPETEVEPEPAPEPEPRVRANKAARDAAAELLATADRARREGRAAEAVAALQALLQRHARDPRAPSAAFSLGRVLLETQQRPREAAAAFARVAQLDAKSPLVEDALAREIEAWAKAGDAARARSLAAAYLARFPSGARAAFVRKHAQLE